MTSSTDYEIVPLTDDQMQAWRELRFVTTNVERSMAWGCTNDPAVQERTGYPSGSIARQIISDPEGLREYETRSSHPHVIALVLDLMRERGLIPKEEAAA